MLTRRRFLRTGGAAAAGALVGGVYGVRFEPHWLEVTRRELPVAGLPGTLRGATLVQLSDLHVGGWMDDGYIVSVLERVRRLAPDFIVHTGDFVTQRLGGPFLERLSRVMRHAPRGRLGTLGILGNHDYGGGWLAAEYPAERAAAVCAHVEAAGVTMLRNAHLTLAGLTWVGIDDLWSGRLDLARALDGVPPEAPAIHLCHNPDGADLPGWEGRRGWILSGHTHGGQVRLPFLPPLVLNVRNRRYVAGAFDLRDGRRLYVSRGVGYVTPIRIGVRPEVAVFTLVPV